MEKIKAMVVEQVAMKTSNSSKEHLLKWMTKNQSITRTQPQLGSLMMTLLKWLETLNLSMNLEEELMMIFGKQ
jgi:hypothetical protein